MHSKKTVLTALLGLSLFVLGIAVGQGWFTPQPARAQYEFEPYPGPQIVFFGLADALPAIVDIDGYIWTTNASYEWTRRAQVLPPNTAIPTGQESVGGLEGSYNK